MNSNDRRLSPFTSHLPQQLLEEFVGRSQELDALRRTFQSGVRGIQVVGLGGSGKTLLARVFAERFTEQFPGGTCIAASSLLESPESFFQRVLHVARQGAWLLVVDAAEDIDEQGIRRLQDALSHDHQLRLLVTSRRHLPLEPDFQILAIQGLSRADFRELLRIRHAFANGQIDEYLVETLFNLAGGNPLMGDLAVAAVQEGVVTSWAQLFEQLRTFQVPGILGPDGRPIDSQSEEFKKVVIDVTAANTEILRLLQKQPDLAWGLPPRKFEEIVAEILSNQGYEIQLTPASGDGGFGIYAARQDGLGKFLYLVECKRYVPPNKVGVEIVRSLYGVIQSMRATAGAIVSTSFFTAGAKDFQREVEHQLQLHDFLTLQQWIKDFPIIRMDAA